MSSTATPVSTMSTSLPIVIPDGQLETHFIYFYDLQVRIHPISTKELTSEGFELQNLSKSELCQFYFSDSFLSRWIRAHFHGDAVHATKTTLQANKHEFAFPEMPHSTDRKYPDYSCIECTLFDNGILAVVLRVKNKDDIPDLEYLECIARPEHLASSHIEMQPGSLISGVDAILQLIEPQIAAFLNNLNLSVVHIDGGHPRPLYVISHAMPAPGGSEELTKFKIDVGNDELTIQPINETNSAHFNTRANQVQDIYQGQSLDPLSKDAKGKTWTRSKCPPVLHLLQRSRPYIGSIVDLTEQFDKGHRILSDLLEKPIKGDWRSTVTSNGEVLKTRVNSFAIAAARTTPKFLDSFANIEQYWNEIPRRDIYYPGPSIVFIGRRGWTCIKLEDRDQLAFHLGVVETVLFTLQATLASFRATRRFVEQIKTRGDEVSRLLNEKLGRRGISLSYRLPERIRNFTSFLARARLHAPVDDMSIQLRSYLMTHTGIFAVRRVKELLNYDTQMENARYTIANYAASLQGANQFWTARTARYQAIGILLALFTFLAGLIAVYLNFKVKIP